MEVALTVQADEITRASRTRRPHPRHPPFSAPPAHRSLGRQRYLAVDPANRLVADHLEADYNTALRELASAKDDYDTAKTRAQRPLDDAHRGRIRALAADFPALWNDPATPMRERKRLIRLLVTDVTLVKTGQHITVSIRLSGGQHHTMTLPRPLTAWELHTTTDDTMKLADQLLDGTPTTRPPRCSTNAVGAPVGTNRSPRPGCARCATPATSPATISGSATKAGSLSTKSPKSSASQHKRSNAGTTTGC